MLTRSGLVTGGQPTKPRGEWVQKVEDKQPTVDLDKIKETFMHACIEFCIPYPPASKGKEPQISNSAMKLQSDWNASSNTTVCQEVESTSNVKSFLQSCLKLIQDESV